MKKRMISFLSILVAVIVAAGGVGQVKADNVDPIYKIDDVCTSSDDVAINTNGNLVIDISKITDTAKTELVVGTGIKDLSCSNTIKSVKFIGENKNIKKLTISDNTFEQKEQKKSNVLESVEFPSELEDLIIGKEVFQQVSSESDNTLIRVKFPEKLKNLKIQKSAFRQSSVIKSNALTHVKFPERLISLDIEFDAFSQETSGEDNNNSLESVEFPIELKTLKIGGGAFYQFSYLTGNSLSHVKFPEKAESLEIGKDAFRQDGNDNALSSVVFPKGLEQLTIKDGAFYQKASNSNALSSVVFPEGLRSLVIERWAFGQNAASGNATLNNIEFPKGLINLRIDELAFYQSTVSGTASLKNIEFPDGLEDLTIESRAFFQSISKNGFNSLTHVKFPESLKNLSIGDEVFGQKGDNPTLEYLYFPIEKWRDRASITLGKDIIKGTSAKLLWDGVDGVTTNSEEGWGTVVTEGSSVYTLHQKPRPIDFEDVVGIYAKDMTLYFENLEKGSTVTIITPQNVEKKPIANAEGKISETFGNLGITDITGVQVKVTAASGKKFEYTLKKIPFGGKKINSDLKYIKDGDYYTYYSTEGLGDRQPLRLNHDLVVEKNGALYVNGQSGTGFAVGYDGKGSLTIEKGGAVTVKTFYHNNASSLTSSTGDTEGSIIVNGGLYQADSKYVSFGETLNTQATTTGTLRIMDKGKVRIKASMGVRLGAANELLGSNNGYAQGSIEVTDGSFELDYGDAQDNFQFGYAADSSTALGEIKLAKGQIIKINNKTFASYDDNFGELKKVESTPNSAYIYYNWDGTNGHYVNNENTVVFDYGASKDTTLKYDSALFSGLKTKSPGEGSYTGILSKLPSSKKAKDNGYQLNEYILETVKVKVNKAIVKEQPTIVNQVVDYGSKPNLPKEVAVTLNDNSIEDVKVDWDLDNLDNFNPKDVSTQTVEGELLYPDHIAGYVTRMGSRITAEVTVNEATIKAKEEIEGIVVLAGENIELPKTINVQLNNGEWISVGVRWNETGYNPNQVGNQDIEGMLDYPPYVSSSADAKVVAHIVVNEKTAGGNLPNTATPPTGVVDGIFWYGMIFLGGSIAGLEVIRRKRKA